ncbi:acyltransferase [Dactylosporangium matsuzakiense]|uniref:O-antigen acetylase n=1 Tax=Dactylosporangium matsuzakiense TaxID=53360 RepID=A0A9W6KU59_9ACTN|nr:O-antigen acetylase [Dactylosporangium matsuzakiense]
MITLRDRYDPKSNGLGLLRLGLALSVLVAHAWPLGLGRPNPGESLTRGQADLGSLAVDGFFVLSGFLVAASARRGNAARFLWHRVLRIFPGLWVCLLGTAVVATVTGHSGGLGFVRKNFLGAVHQWGIGTLFADTPYGRLVQGSVANGSLWSLVYELLCYCGLAALVVAGLPRRAPWVVPVLAAGAYVVIAADAVHDPTVPKYRGGLGPLPIWGYVDFQLAVYLGFLFLLGASMQLYAHRVVLHPAIAAGAALALLGSLVYGGFFAVGYPALAYLLVYCACVVPPRLHAVGREQDYSYGIYIYAFPVQQTVAHFGGASWGLLPYITVCLPLVLLVAAASWHLVERPALALKHRPLLFARWGFRLSGAGLSARRSSPRFTHRRSADPEPPATGGPRSTPTASAGSLAGTGRSSSGS